MTTQRDCPLVLFLLDHPGRHQAAASYRPGVPGREDPCCAGRLLGRLERLFYRL